MQNLIIVQVKSTPLQRQSFIPLLPAVPGPHLALEDGDPILQDHDLLLHLEEPIEALEALEDLWSHAKAYLAVANACSSHIDIYRNDAADYLQEYMESAGDGANCTIAPVGAPVPAPKAPIAAALSSGK